MLTYITELKTNNPEDHKLVMELLCQQRDLVNMASKIHFEENANSIVKLHKLFYYPAREKFPETPSQIVIKAEQECLANYKSIKSNKHKLKKPLEKKNLSLRLDERIYSHRNEQNKISITTKEGRKEFEIVLYKKLQVLMDKHVYLDPLIFIKNDKLMIALTFDTRAIVIKGFDKGTTFTLDPENDVLPGADGFYEIVRPNRVPGTTGSPIVTAAENFYVSFESKALNSTAGLLLIKDRLSAPAGAAEFTKVESVVTVANNNAGGVDLPLAITPATPLGEYVYRITLGPKSIDVKVRIVDITPEIKFEQYLIGGTKFDVAVTNVVGANRAVRPLVYAGVPKNADGTYTIIKDYIAGTFKTFKFNLEGENFLIPDTFATAATLSQLPNSLQATIVGPNSVTFIPVASGRTNGNLTPVQFRSKLAIPEVVHNIDSTTPVGDYTYNFRVLQLGVEIYSKSLTIRVVEPKTEMTVLAGIDDVLKQPLTFVQAANEAAINALAAGSKVLGTVYVAIDTNVTYVWNGTAMVVDTANSIAAANLAALNALAAGSKVSSKVYYARDTSLRYRWNGTAFVLDNANTTVAPGSFKPLASGIYQIEKPLNATSEPKDLFFNFRLTNFESMFNPGASADVSFVGADSKVKDFLPFETSVSGPQTLIEFNNTRDTMIGIELDSSGSTALVGNRLQTTSANFKQYEVIRAPSLSNSVDILNVFKIRVGWLTSVGTYTFTYKLGQFSDTIKVERSEEHTSELQSQLRN
jgi:predicted transposase